MNHRSRTVVGTCVLLALVVAGCVGAGEKNFDTRDVVGVDLP